jgi:hypothetical protein
MVATPAAPNDQCIALISTFGDDCVSVDFFSVDAKAIVDDALVPRTATTPCVCVSFKTFWITPNSFSWSND